MEDELLPGEVVWQAASPATENTPPASSEAPSQAKSEVIPSWEEQPANAALSPTEAGLAPSETINDTVFVPIDAPEAPAVLDETLSATEPDSAILSELSASEAPEIPPHRPRRIPRSIAAIALFKWGAWALAIVGAAALIALALTTRSWGTTLATRSWGTIALRDGIALLGIGAGAAALALLYSARQHRQVRRRWRIITASLLLLGILAMALSPTIHVLQGHRLESQANYQRAIEEYAASGEHAPDGQDIARSYLEWGRQNLKQQDYADAVQHLGMAAQRYTATPAAKQAREPVGQALLLYGQELFHAQRYSQAIQQFDVLRARYNDTAAAQQAVNEQDEPAAYFAWGQMLLSNEHFQDALTTFQRLGQLFPDSPYATQAYNAAAGDLYAWGKALVQQAKYDQAIKTDQQLIAQYPNAPEAQQAQQDLAAPQQVIGRLIFTDGTPDANVVIRLSSQWTTGSSGYAQGGYVFEAHTDSTGAFTFTAVDLGTYLVDWQQGSGFTTLLHDGTYDPVYTATVQPLRAADLGDIQIPPPD
ncbi:MAG TPA: tetratricopeptide repeat protein [Ktedonobacterales bacterium]|nr:tetratricopeptide repeat protein [Ktedonobacterales bacterium]